MNQLATIPQNAHSEVRDLDANTRIEDIHGAERAAIVLLALGEEHGRSVWAALDDDEIRRISIAMSKLGKVAPEVVEKLLGQYVMELGKAGALVGNFENTERLLVQFLPQERVTAIMEEIRVNDPDYYPDATWYLGLSLLKTDRIAEARQIMQELVDGPDAFYSAKAAIVLERFL